MENSIFKDKIVEDFNSTIVCLNIYLRFHRCQDDSFYTQLDEINNISVLRIASDTFVFNLIKYLGNLITNDNYDSLSKIIEESIAVYADTIKKCDEYMYKRYSLSYDSIKQIYFMR